MEWMGVSDTSCKLNSAPRKDSERERSMPRPFMSIATISIAPTPRLEISRVKVSASGNDVPCPHRPSRSMYDMWVSSEAPVADT